MCQCLLSLAGRFVFAITNSYLRDRSWTFWWTVFTLRFAESALSIRESNLRHRLSVSTTISLFGNSSVYRQTEQTRFPHRRNRARSVMRRIEYFNPRYLIDRTNGFLRIIIIIIISYRWNSDLIFTIPTANDG